jgi:hypothetical protein
MRCIFSRIGITAIVPFMLLLGGCGWESLTPPTPGDDNNGEIPSQMHVRIVYECTDCVESEGGTAPLTFKFRAEVTLPDPERDRVLLYSWNFGDGSLGEGGQVRHTYEQPGTYEVRLRVITTSGAEARDMVQVIVEEPTPPEAKVQRDFAEGALCSFERVLPEEIRAGDQFSVQVTITAKQEIQIAVWEDNVWFPEFRLKHEPSALWLGIKAGETKVLRYDANLWKTPQLEGIWMSGTLSCNPGGMNDSEILTLKSLLNVIRETP